MWKKELKRGFWRSFGTVLAFAVGYILFIIAEVLLRGQTSFNFTI